MQAEGGKKAFQAGKRETMKEFNKWVQKMQGQARDFGKRRQRTPHTILRRPQIIDLDKRGGVWRM